MLLVHRLRLAASVRWYSCPAHNLVEAQGPAYLVWSEGLTAQRHCLLCYAIDIDLSPPMFNAKQTVLDGFQPHLDWREPLVLASPLLISHVPEGAFHRARGAKTFSCLLYTSPSPRDS